MCPEHVAAFLTGVSLSGLPPSILRRATAAYSIGVWSERIQGRLKVWHTVFFWMGFVCDTWGTGMMMKAAGGLTSDIHGVTGVIAIGLMMIHAFWATVVLMRKDEKAIINFHTFSLEVWFIWLIPYLSPMIINMPSVN